MIIKIFGKTFDFGNKEKKEYKKEDVAQNALNKVIETIYQEDILPKPRLIFQMNTGNVTVIFEDGETLCGNIDVLTYSRLKELTDKEKIYKLLAPKEEVKEEIYDQEEAKEAEIVSNFLDIFEDSDDFEVRDNKVYFKNINVPIPTSIVAYFIELLEQKEAIDFEDEYNALKSFTLKLLLNPIKKSQETLLDFVKNNNVDLTSSGNLILFRNIVTKNAVNKQYVEFVSNQYLKIKHQKKSPKNYFVYEDLDTKDLFLNANDETKIKDHEQFGIVGNLYDCYQSLQEKQEKLYTDAHTKTYDIKVGSVYKIREEDIQLNKDGSCGGLLHCAAKEGFDYSGFGDTRVCVLINPMFAARTDTGYSSKIGVEQMFIVGVLENGEEVPNLVDFDTEYDRVTIEELEESLRNKSLATVSIAEVPSPLTIKEVVDITTILKNRVVKI